LRFIATHSREQGEKKGALDTTRQRKGPGLGEDGIGWRILDQITSSICIMLTMRQSPTKRPK